MTHQLSLCVIGDLMLDIVTRIPELHLGSVDYPKGFDGPRPIDLRVGGAGAHLARAAAQQGFSPVTLIGKVGAQPDGQPDLTARMITAELEQHGIRMLLARDERAATGKVIMTYLGHDQRVMVYDRGANGQFTRADLSSTVLKEIAGADIVFVSGYTLLVPEQAEAVVSCMQEAYQHRRLVVLDVVPHKLQVFVSAFSLFTIGIAVGLILSAFLGFNNPVKFWIEKYWAWLILGIYIISAVPLVRLRVINWKDALFGIIVPVLLVVIPFFLAR